MTDEIAEFARVARLLADPANAEPCATYPIDPDGARRPGIHAWHGDAEADRVLGAVLGASLHPLFVDHAGGMSFRTRRASAATLQSAIGRTHLRGGTQGSSFRRSLAALLWNELGLRCDRPKRLDAASNERLTSWMLEHLSVVTVPYMDRWLLTHAFDFSSRWINPPFNLTGYGPSRARRVIRQQRKRYFSLATADDERIRRIVDMERLVELDPDGSEFLRRRIAQEFDKLQQEWAS
jgi:hypothetical protein